MESENLRNVSSSEAIERKVLEDNISEIKAILKQLERKNLEWILYIAEIWKISSQFRKKEILKQFTQQKNKIDSEMENHGKSLKKVLWKRTEKWLIANAVISLAAIPLSLIIWTNLIGNYDTNSNLAIYIVLLALALWINTLASIATLMLNNFKKSDNYHSEQSLLQSLNLKHNNNKKLVISNILWTLDEYLTCDIIEEKKHWSTSTSLLREILELSNLINELKLIISETRNLFGLTED